MTTHVVACIWIITGQFDEDIEGSWLANYELTSEKNDIYLTAFYFTVTTITTVGYGDMPITTNAEKVIVIFIMLIGVIAFGVTSGSLTNYLSSIERKSE